MMIQINKNGLYRNIKNNYLFLIFFILIFFLHLFMGLINDDLNFYSTILSNSSFLDFLIIRYYGWSSRLIIDAFTALIARENIFIWKLLDSLIYTIGAYLVIKIINMISNYKYDEIIKYFGILLFLMFPFYEMGSAGWIATTSNYLWCFGLGMVSFLPLINHHENKKNGILVYIISIFCLLYSTNQEQCCALIFGLNMLYLINLIIKKEKLNKYNLIAIFISFLSLIFILTCPGNAVRLVSEINTWYPEFAKFTIMHKIYLGTIPTLGVFIQDKIIFTLFYIMLNICCLVKIKNKYLKYICYLNICLILFLVIFNGLIEISGIESSLIFQKGIISNVNNLTLSVSNHVNVILSHVPTLTQSIKLFTYHGIPHLNMYSLITISISIYLLFSCLLMLLKIFGKNNLFPLVLFIAGFMSRFIMGFSPTVFASSSRTSIFFYMILISLILLLITELYKYDKINKKYEQILKIVCILSATVSYFYTLLFFF